MERTDSQETVIIKEEPTTSVSTRDDAGNPFLLRTFVGHNQVRIETVRAVAMVPPESDRKRKITSDDVGDFFRYLENYRAPDYPHLSRFSTHNVASRVLEQDPAYLYAKNGPIAKALKMARLRHDLKPWF